MDVLLEDIIKALQEIAPEHYAMEWDNVGLLVGDPGQQIQRIYIALDADEAAISETKAAGAQLLLTHHPMIFSPLKKINTDHFISARVVDLLWSHINYYAMHTNFDIAKMADLASGRIGLMNTKPLEYAFTENGLDYGIGNVGQIGEPVSLKDLCEQVKAAFELKAVKVFGEPVRTIRTVAVCPGSGKSVIKEALAAGADVLVTGDIDHHSGIDAAAQGLSIIDAGHYGLEHIFIDYMKKELDRKLPAVEIIAQERRDPFQIL